MDYVPSSGVLLSGGLSGKIRLHTLVEDQADDPPQVIQAHSGIVRCIKVIEGGLFATGGEDSKVRVWDLGGTQVVESSHSNFVQSIEFLEDDTIISASYDGSIRKWSLVAPKR